MKYAIATASLPFACACSSAPIEDPISTDRPGFLFSTSTVPEHRLQLEVASPAVAIERGSVDTTTIALGPQFRYGLMEGLELRLGGVPYAYSESKSDDGNTYDDGPGDAEVGFKYRISTEVPAVLIAGVRLPVGDDPFTTHQPGYSLNALASTGAGADRTLTGLIGWTRTPDAEGGDFDAGSLALLLSQPVTERFTANLEGAWFPALETGPDPAYAGAYGAYLLSSNSQLDLSVDAGLNDEAADWILSFGWSVRW